MSKNDPLGNFLDSLGHDLPSAEEAGAMQDSQSKFRKAMLLFIDEDFQGASEIFAGLVDSPKKVDSLMDLFTLVQETEAEIYNKMSDLPEVRPELVPNQISSPDQLKMGMIVTKVTPLGREDYIVISPILDDKYGSYVEVVDYTIWLLHPNSDETVYKEEIHMADMGIIAYGSGRWNSNQLIDTGETVESTVVEDLKSRTLSWKDIL